jgi:hypothetical protein
MRHFPLLLNGMNKQKQATTDPKVVDLTPADQALHELLEQELEDDATWPS